MTNLQMQETLTERLLIENEELRSRLAETEATLEAIRNGEVDAIVVSGLEGDKIFTLASAETPYRIIIEEMDEGAVTISEEGIILYCNRRFANLLCTPIEQVIGAHINEFLTDCNQYVLQSLLKEGSEQRIKEEITTVNYAGLPIYLHLSMCLLPEGMLGKICIIVTDITELKKHQQNLQMLVDERTQDLNSANTELKEINATKDKLFSIIAHDLRGPFTSLLGFSDLLLENAGSYEFEKFQKIVFHINSAAKSAFTLLENLLIWARSQNGQLLYKPKNINIPVVLKEVISNLHSLAVIKNIKINYLGNQDIIGYADENMLHAIVRNLITNAIKFCNPGGLIEITAIYKEKEVEIAVKDNGVGMTEEVKNKLFKIDGGMSHTGTAHEKGTGLGLLICKDFVEKHKGKIWVESQAMVGSKFIFTLPHKTKNSKM